MTHATTLIPFSTRFAQALGMLCTATPSVALCVAWMDGTSDELQEWVLNHLRLDWAQGIETIDAARAIAEHCEEGRPELLSYEEERAARFLAKGPVQLVTKRKRLMVADCPDDLKSEAFLALMREDFAVRDSASRLHLARDVVLGA